MNQLLFEFDPGPGLVRSLRLSKRPKAVLTWLTANRIDQADCVCRQADMARDLERTERTVRRGLADLERLGLIHRLGRQEGRYRIRWAEVRDFVQEQRGNALRDAEDATALEMELESQPAWTHL